VGASEGEGEGGRRGKSREEETIVKGGKGGREKRERGAGERRKKGEGGGQKLVGE